MKTTALFAAALLVLTSVSRAQERAVRASATAVDDAPAMWAALVPGEFNVGYRRLGNSRNTVHVWYPSKSSANRLTIRDYLRTDTTRLRLFLVGANVSDSTIAKLLASRMFATESASPLDQTFPLVLVAQGNGQDVFDQVVLCEYLASYGFVVATTPSPMLRTPMTADDQVGMMAAIQGTELSLAIRSVTSASKVDASGIGIVGHSFGARAALLLAMNNAKVKAIVSFDGGIGTSTAVASFRKAPSFTSTAPLPPLLHFYETLDAFMTPDFSLIKSLHFQSVTLTPVENMHHTQFTTYGFAAALFPDLATLTQANAGTGRSVVQIHQATRDFLVKYLKGK